MSGMQGSLPKFATAPFCPSEVRGSIAIAPGAPWWQRVLRFAGPGLLVAVGYMDPGNWATDIEAGSVFGYSLLFVVLLSSLAAIKTCQHTIAAVGKPDEAATSAYRIAAQSRAHCVEQNAVKLAPMDRELRRFEAGIGTAKLAPHHLAEAVGVDQLARADAGAVERGQQTECGEFLDRMRQSVDADT